MENATNTVTAHGTHPPTLVQSDHSHARIQIRWEKKIENGVDIDNMARAHTVRTTRCTWIIISVLRYELRAPHPHSSTINNEPEKIHVAHIGVPRGRYGNWKMIRTYGRLRVSVCAKIYRNGSCHVGLLCRVAHARCTPASAQKE